jgi:phosphotransferase system IIB component
MHDGDGEPFPAFEGADFIAVMEASMLKLRVIVNNVSVTSRQLIEKAKPRHIFGLMNEYYHFFILQS